MVVEELDLTVNPTRSWRVEEHERAAEFMHGVTMCMLLHHLKKVQTILVCQSDRLSVVNKTAVINASADSRLTFTNSE